MPETLYPPRKYVYGPKKSEIEVLKAAHKFLRPEDEDARKLDWDNALAHKYYSSLYREYAVCDLKHFKSGNISLRWRTEDEVVAGIGEMTCGNPRCKHHEPDHNTDVAFSGTRRWDDESEVGESSSKKRKEKKLVTLELPFTYEEDDKQKTALVKVVLCERCVKKVNWKRDKDKEKARGDVPEEDVGPSIPSKAVSSQRSRSRSPIRASETRARSRPRGGEDGEKFQRSRSRREHEH